jgi:hypothetical protein
MIDKFGDDRLNARAEPIAAEIDAERKLLQKCGATTTTTPRR